jgi:metallopeptidase MepB
VSEDIYATVFKENPRNTEAARKYLKALLEPGASQDEMEMVTEFLGRQPSKDAFFKNLRNI